MLLVGIAGGVISGIIIAILGYAKSVTVESFKPEKAAQTIIIGAIVGGYASYAGIGYDQAYEYLGTIGGITLVEFVKKAIWRAIVKLRKK